MSRIVRANEPAKRQGPRPACTGGGTARPGSKGISMMRTPQFWFTPPDRPAPAARLLSPLAGLYAWGTARRLRRQAGTSINAPVICIGNLNAGGTGKTPTVIAVSARLREQQGLAPHIVSRGHGGRLTGPVRVCERTHDAGDVGDEALLLAASAPAWIGRDRAEAAQAAQAAGADVIVLDDGFQNPSVAKDISVVVVDAGRGFGNGRTIPAGPLREPVRTGLARADILLSIGEDSAQRAFDSAWGDAVNIPRMRGRLVPLQTGMDWTGLRVFAFAGIGHPEKFFATLRGLGAEVVGARALADHQPLSAALMRRLLAEAQAKGAEPVTTEKDAARLPAGVRGKVLSLPVRLQIDDWSVFDAALARVMAGHTA